MKIRDLMTRDVETVSPDHTAQEAASFMLRADAGAIPVCEDGRVVGMITDRDIAVRGVAEGLGPDASVRQLMTSDVHCANADDDVADVAEQMSESQVRRLPVVDSDQRLVGIISLADLSREADAETAGDVLESVSTPGGPHQQ